MTPAGSEFAAENRVLTSPMLIAAIHSGARDRARAPGRMPPSPRPVARAIAARMSGGAIAVVNARPISQARATPSFDERARPSEGAVELGVGEIEPLDHRGRHRLVRR